MNALIQLVDKIRETCSPSNDAELARVLRVSRQTVCHWRTGENVPNPVACARIAELTGEPLARVLGIAGQTRAVSQAEKAVWRRLSLSAVVLLALGATAAPELARAANVYYVNVRRVTFRKCKALQTLMMPRYRWAQVA